jgi:hypothetical protein
MRVDAAICKPAKEAMPVRNAIQSRNPRRWTIWLPLVAKPRIEAGISPVMSSAWLRGLKVAF